MRQPLPLLILLRFRRARAAEHAMRDMPALLSRGLRCCDADSVAYVIAMMLPRRGVVLLTLAASDDAQR